MAPITGRAVDSADENLLREAYRSLVRAGNDSVRAAWRLGQCIDSFSDTYTRKDMADAMGVHSGTVYRYHRFYLAYQRPELAIKASEQLQTYNIDLIYELQNQLTPVEHGRPYAGRKYRYRCQHCQSTEVQREEVTDPAELAALMAEREGRELVTA